MTANEKQAFAERLKLALRRSQKPVETPAELALQFNLRHHEDVTPQAAQKWMTGTAKPTSDKIATLADWLGVSAHWLNYGTSNERPANQAKSVEASKVAKSVSELTAEELALMSRYRTLTACRRKLVNDLVTEFALEQMVWPEGDPASDLSRT